MATKRGDKYLIPRAGDQVWVTPTNREERIHLRTELELLRRCRMPAIDPRLAALEVRAGRSDDPDLADLQVIVCDAWSALVDSAIDEIDQHFPDIRQEIRMATIEGVTTEIRNDALAAGDAGVQAASETPQANDTENQTGDSSTTAGTVEESSAPSDTAAETAVDQPTATSEPEVDDATDDAPTPTPDAESSPPEAEAADATTPAATSDSETDDEPTNIEEMVESTAALVDQLAEQVEEITSQCEDEAEAESTQLDDASTDETTTNDVVSEETMATPTDEPANELDEGVLDSPADSDTAEAGDAAETLPTVAENGDTDNSAAEQVVAEPETLDFEADTDATPDAATPTETEHTIPVDGEASPDDVDGDASPDGASVDQPADSVETPPDECDLNVAATDDPQPAAAGSSVVSVAGSDENVSWTEADPSAVNGFVGSADAVEVAVRNLIDFLSSEVLQKWQAVRSTFDASLGLKAQVEESLTEARALCEELKALQGQVSAAATTAESTASEAHVFRDEAREARTRADAQAREAEVAADRARSEAADAERHALRAQSCSGSAS